jgi:hypothetical protein
LGALFKKSDEAKPVEIEAIVEAKPAPAYRRFTSTNAHAPSSFLPAPQPKADEEAKDTSRKAGVSKFMQKHSPDLAAPKPKPEEEPEELEPEEPTEEPDQEQEADQTRPLEGHLNLWRGFGVEARKGSWKLMRDHIYNVLGAGDPKASLYIERWLAYTVQHPDVVGETVLVLQGDEGTGKGTLARAMLKIFGPHGLPVTQPKHLVGGFSGHLQYCCFLFLDEAFWAGDVQAGGRLKSLITEDTVTIEPKYFTPFQVPNLLHILMSIGSCPLAHMRAATLFLRLATLT